MVLTPPLKVFHFRADWAEQCPVVDGVLEELRRNFGDKEVDFIGVDAEAIPEISSKYGISAVPTVLLLMNEEVVDRIDGANASEITKKIKHQVARANIFKDQLESPKEPLEDRLKRLVHSAPCMLFMKGSAEKPQCGFSRQMVELLNKHNASYCTFDILTDEEVRQGLKKFSDWPTYPQLYVKGNLIGGLDIAKEMDANGELASLLPKKQSLEERLKTLINKAPLMVFMKGTPEVPKCGFSRTLVQILHEIGVKFETFDILGDEEVREGLKKFSDWPTYPQVYVKGELVGGLDIIKELQKSGQLVETLTPNRSTRALLVCGMGEASSSRAGPIKHRTRSTAGRDVVRFHPSHVDDEGLIDTEDESWDTESGAAEFMIDSDEDEPFVPLYYHNDGRSQDKAHWPTQKNREQWSPHHARKGQVEEEWEPSSSILDSEEDGDDVEEDLRFAGWSVPFEEEYVSTGLGDLLFLNRAMQARLKVEIDRLQEFLMEVHAAQKNKFLLGFVGSVAESKHLIHCIHENIKEQELKRIEARLDVLKEKKLVTINKADQLEVHRQIAAAVIIKNSLKKSEASLFVKGKNQKIDWMKISCQMKRPRSDLECYLIWVNCLHPSIYKASWSDEEVEVLEDKVKDMLESHCHVDWNKVSSFLSGRTPLQCLRRFRQLEHKKIKRWKVKEEKSLAEIVSENDKADGHVRWYKVSAIVGNRTRKQLSDHWTTVGTPLQGAKFTLKEDHFLLAAHMICGNNWAQISAFMPGRSRLQVKNRCKALAKGAPPVWSLGEDRILMEHVREKGPRFWSLVASSLGGLKEGTRCRARWLRLEKYLPDDSDDLLQISLLQQLQHLCKLTSQPRIKKKKRDQETSESLVSDCELQRRTKKKRQETCTATDPLEEDLRSFFSTKRMQSRHGRPRTRNQTCDSREADQFEKSLLLYLGLGEMYATNQTEETMRHQVSPSPLADTVANALEQETKHGDSFWDILNGLWSRDLIEEPCLEYMPPNDANVTALRAMLIHRNRLRVLAKGASEAGGFQGMKQTFLQQFLFFFSLPAWLASDRWFGEHGVEADEEPPPPHNCITPGGLITSATGFMRGHGTYMEDENLYASVAGVIQKVNKLISVRGFQSRYQGEVGDVVIGRVLEVAGKRWKVDTNSRLDSILQLSSVNLPGGELRRKTAEDEKSMRQILQEGDVISAEVHNVYADGSLALHTRSLKYGKLKEGTMVKAPPCLILRRKTHFHSLPCGVTVVLGNNGYIWIAPTSADPEGGAAPLSINEADRQVVARVRNCISALSSAGIVLYDTSILYAFEASNQYPEVKMLLKPEISANIAKITRLRLEMESDR
ncbi:unnamed protein product [Darwinula stevensoni]|uniref:Ribosomal RNA-processing protein 4 n=1 Tax=Darwinula stevensoni TaxID=69355 RepID=A0A7R8XG53_9CRUS|nr:unnamed protein product [Darwinula stevensoni]CAG0892268.1 unnamed protein product [Darwinula stevensoni]